MPEPSVTAPAAAPPQVEVPPDPPAPLAHFFAALRALETGAATDDVRIVELGDSHTAADYETGTTRRQLQARFGDGGRGFVMLGRPWKAWSQEGVLSGMTADWNGVMTPLTGDRPASTGVFGLAGVAIVTRMPGARAWTDVLAPTTRFEVDYLEQPGGGTFDVLVDNKRLARLSSKAEQSRSAFHAFDVEPAPVHRIEARVVGDGEVRIFGMALDRADQRGVVYDALGMNGARILMPLSWSEPHWAEQLAHRAPALVVLAYGTNDAVAVDMAAATFEQDLGDVIGRVKRAAPAASCLVLGPPDRANKVGAAWKTPPKLLEIVESERKVAAASGCAFFDRLAAMGGEGAIAKWAAAGNLAQQDRVHLTREGYAQVGSALVKDLLGQYEASYRSSSSRPTASPDR